MTFWDWAHDYPISTTILVWIVVNGAQKIVRDILGALRSVEVEPEGEGGDEQP